jgi:pyrroline-5-carboxylate reductase
MKRISIIGTGNMGSALIKGVTASGMVKGEDIVIFDVDHQRCDAMKEQHGLTVASEIGQAVGPDMEAVVLAVKPQIMALVLARVAHGVTARSLVISIAAGIPTDFILSHLPAGSRVIRAMPNAAAMVGRSATALCKAGAADEADLDRAAWLFSSFGIALKVEEKVMNAVTGLSGSGPAYLFVMMEALTDGGVLMGMDRATARALAVQTIIGSAEMALSGSPSFSELKDRITSPGGTTIAGLRVLERAGIRGILMEAVAAATLRSEELQPH